MPKEDAGEDLPTARGAGQVQRYKLTVAYDGTNFHGWQKQHPPGEPALRTVQGVLELALCKLLRQRIVTAGASRTDAGVHALGQVVQFDAACPIPLDRLPHAINSRLPEDVDVRSAEQARADFDAIRDVVSKQYRYRIFNADRRPLGLRRMVCHLWTPLDIDQMNDAARRLVGRHDFGGFAAAGHGRASTVRTIHHCHVERTEEELIDIIVAGDGFLWNMVRIIAGTLTEVGRGRFEPPQVDRVLASANRQLAGPTLGPEGLCLQWVRYGPAGHDAECNLQIEQAPNLRAEPGAQGRAV